MEAEYIQMIQNLAGVLGAIFLLVYFLKKLSSRKSKLNQDIKILQVVPIGNKEKILLVSVKDKTILIGATPNHIETLHIFNDPVRPLGTDDMPVIKTDTFAETMDTVS
jgi:flagellar protein FliO/FliZ